MKPDDRGLVQAILFVSGEAVRIEDLCEWTSLPEEELAEVLESLESEAEGLIVRRFGDSVQLVTNPRYAQALRRIFSPDTEEKLSSSLLETLTIIAYRQPVTRLEVEELRGVRSAYSIGALCDKGLVERIGTRDVLGHPAEYGTTEEFLRQFDLRSLDDLPQVKDQDDEPPTLEV